MGGEEGKKSDSDVDGEFREAARLYKAQIGGTF